LFQQLTHAASDVICDQVEVQMFQLYRDGLDDLLKENKKPAKGEEEKKPTPLKITLAEHSPTGLVIVSVLYVHRLTCFKFRSHGNVLVRPVWVGGRRADVNRDVSR
jgi:hypothetical protein